MTTNEPPHTQTQREGQLIDAFVSLADTLVEDYDVADFAQVLVDCCTDLLQVDAGGLMLEHHGELRVMASSNHSADTLELFEVQHREGPCYHAYETGEQLSIGRLSDVADRWPRFVEEAGQRGWRSAHAVPLQLRGARIGALNLFSRAERQLGESDSKLVRALADVATIGVLQERATTEASSTASQLERALDSRVRIEQAKGRIAEQGGLAESEAFERLRRFARHHNRRLLEVCHEVIDGSIGFTDLSR